MRILTLLLSALAFAASAQQPTAVKTTVDVDDYAQFALWQDVKISPNGDYIAAVTWQDGKKVLQTFNTTTMEPIHAIKFRGANKDIEYHWANNERLITKRLFRSEKNASSNTVNSYSVYHTYWPEFYGVNADGSHPRYLQGLKGGRTNSDKISWIDIVDAEAKTDDYMLAVGSPYDDKDDLPVEVFKVNVKYGRAIKHSTSPVYSPKFLTDKDSQLRFVTGYDKEFRVRSYILKQDKWLALDALNRRTNQSFEPIRLDSQNQGVYALYSRKGGPRGLYWFDLDSGYRKKIFQHKQVDIDKIMFDNEHNVYAVSFDDGTPQTKIVDVENPSAKVLQLLSQELPEQTLQVVSQTDDGNTKVIYSFGANDPGSYWLYDVKNKRFDLILKTRPWVDTTSIAKIVPMQYQGYDDLPLSGYITLPLGVDSIEQAKNLPFVVKVHGGPHGHRDRMIYDAQAQLYAANGIGVLQVNFRGSGGFGADFRGKGYKRWGTDIQQDIIYGIRSLVDRGIANEDKLCIVGASFGGFSALSSSIIAPKLFKCAVALNGAYDLSLLYKIGKLKETKLAQYELTLSIGRFSSKLKSISPIEHLDKLKTAVLVIHGENDSRVPIEHAQALQEKLDKMGHDYEYLAIDNMGHQFNNAEQKQQALSASLRFIQKHLGLVTTDDQAIQP